MNARLKVLHQKSNVKQVKLQATTVVGRSPECDLKIASSLVSRVHCRITVSEDAVYVEDLGSANGTFVDGELLKPNQPKAVNPGAKVSIGPADFLVDYVAATSNTVVIRRSESGAKPGLEEIRKTANENDEDSGIFMTSVNAIVEDPGDGSTVRNLRLPPATSDLPESSRPEVRIQKSGSPPPAERTNQNLESAPRPIPESTAAAKAVSAPPRPATTIPTAPQPSSPKVAKPVASASVVAQPVAKPVAPTPQRRSEEPAVPASENPFQFGDLQSPKPTKPKVAGNESVAAAVKNPLSPSVPAARASAAVTPAAPPAVVEFAEFVEVPPEVVAGPAEFQFGDPTEPHGIARPSTKGAKNAGIKSLFSMFGAKQKTTEASSEPSKASPSLGEEHSEPTEKANVARDADAPQFQFGGIETPSNAIEPPAAGGGLDDDFQSFLRQL